MPGKRPSVKNEKQYEALRARGWRPGVISRGYGRGVREPLDVRADSVVSARAPPEYSALAIGAAQLTQTPSGAPIPRPSSALAMALTRDRAAA